ncbi:MAG: hypothetical protein WCD18_01225 [Thermosynechococcaceae cyanobacterium]
MGNVIYCIEGSVWDAIASHPGVHTDGSWVSVPPRELHWTVWVRGEGWAIANGSKR